MAGAPTKHPADRSTQAYNTKGKNPPLPLSGAHRRMLLEESGIAPEIVAERAYMTVTSRTDLGDFKKYQRRAPALLLPMYSPDGQTTGAQIRPDNPRRDKKGKPIKYETAGDSRIIIDVHPSMMEAARFFLEDLWITEGIKKADSLASRGLPTIGLTGVWNWQRDGEMLPCWDHVRLDGRKVFIVFDSDVMSKPEVQIALERLVAALERRGADVRVAYLPDAEDGSKLGVDDYLVAGGTVAELKALSRKFEPQDLGRVRLSRDQKLRAAVGYLWRRWREGDWMRFVGKADKGNWARGHTARDAMEAFIELATSRGKLDGEGVVVRVGLRRLAELAAKSVPSVRKAIAHLEVDGQIEILPPEDEGKPRRYRLLVPRAALSQYGRTDDKEGGDTSSNVPSDHTVKPLRAPAAPRLRWSSPARKARLIRHFEGETGRTVTDVVVGKESPYVKRLGPHRSAVLDTLEAAGGELHLENLCEALRRKRSRDVSRRILKPLEEAGIIECEGNVVRLALDWLAKLEGERERTGEIEQAEEQAEKHREQRARYQEHLKRERRGTPEASLAAVRRTEALREERLQKIRDEEERDRAPTPPAAEALVTQVMNQNKRVRMGLLCSIAMDEGLRWRDVPPAVRRMGYRIERLPEHDNAEFIFARKVVA